ncbi:MAG: sugar phosphate isomerase/epimerase [Akkermansia sp.]|nr:sugar phosphate isomerase/epimerase [Akkermansia sp.]
MNVFSTCWNSARHTDGGAMCDEIRELGFEYIEASHGLSLALMPGLMQAVDEGRIHVAGVHNFCPAPIDVAGDAPDAYRLTSHRPEERARAMRLSMETLLVAARLGARYVVLHLGEVELFRGHRCTRELQRLVRHGYRDTLEYARLKGKYVRRRVKLAPLYYERARVALHKLAERAKELNLVLGVEGRSHFEQVPGEPEMPRLMAEFADNPHVRYWHDFGHIQRKHNLLLLNHDQYLRRLAPHIYGAHVNDVQWPQRDHRAPFQGGDVDFDNLLPRYFTQAMPLTWELSPSVTREAILAARSRWDALHATLPLS